MKDITIEDLKIVSEFQHVPDEQLQWLIEQGETLELEKGERLFQARTPVIYCYILLDGRMRIATEQSGKHKELRILDPGQPTGYLPYSRATLTPAFCEALKKSRVFKCSAAKLKTGFANNYELIEAMVHMMLNRVREFTSIQQQNERMFALGKLSAGLAHELNNPAAAISRDAVSLKSRTGQLPHLFKLIAGLRMSPEQVEKISNLILEKINGEPSVLTMMQKAMLEDEITGWFKKNNLQNVEPEGFAEHHFLPADLEVFKNSSTADDLPTLLEWVNNYLITNKIAEDIHVSAERISNLIGSVKNFTYMDKDSTRQLTDIHAGLRNTLIMMSYKLRKGNIKVVEHYGEIPQMSAFPGELNQVWTNIIDNAIDAMEINGKGELEIKTVCDDRFVKICIKDNGPGIPVDIKQNIFAPFFTTKEMGKGSGLGLDVVSRVMIQHNGIVKVNSTPGLTEFEISLPL